MLYAVYNISSFIVLPTDKSVMVVVVATVLPSAGAIISNMKVLTVFSNIGSLVRLFRRNR